MLWIAVKFLQVLLQKFWQSLNDTKRWRKNCLLVWKIGAEVFEEVWVSRVDHWGRGRKAGAWGGGKGAGFSLLRSEGCRTSSEKCYQTGSGSKGYPGKKSEVGRLWRWERPSKQCGKERKNVRSSEIRVAESKTIWMPGQRHFQHLQQGGFTSGDLHCKPWQGRTQLPSQLVRGAKKKLEWVLPRFKGLFSTVMKKGGQIHHYLGLGL